MLLPEGTYTLRPYIYVKGSAGNVALAPLQVTLGPAQHIEVGDCLQLNLAVPSHVASEQLTLPGSVLTACDNTVTNISYQLDGGVPVTICTGCGSNPNFKLNLVLRAGAHNLTVTARDNQGGVSSISGAIQAGAPPPMLTISRTGINTVTLSWPSPSTGFSLQQASELALGNWVPVLNPPNDNGVTKSITVNTAGARGFYRLAKSAP